MGQVVGTGVPETDVAVLVGAIVLAVVAVRVAEATIVTVPVLVGTTVFVLDWVTVRVAVGGTAVLVRVGGTTVGVQAAMTVMVPVMAGW